MFSQITLNTNSFYLLLLQTPPLHYSDVIMGAMASQITSPTIVYSSVYSGVDKKNPKTSKLRVTDLWAGNSSVTGEFPTQMASDAGNVSMWWRHHRVILLLKDFTFIARWGPLTHPCGNKLHYYWHRKWLLAHLTTNHYTSQDHFCQLNS